MACESGEPFILNTGKPEPACTGIAVPTRDESHG
jgi:hypothetical protein